MINNIIFDFGNVLLGWNEDQIIANYTSIVQEQQVLKKVIFKSDEWFKLDNGSLTYESAKAIFKDNVPNNLKEKVENIMNTWYEKMPLNAEICDLIKKLKGNGYKIYALSNTHIPVYEYVKNLEIAKLFDGFLISAIEKMTKPNECIYYRLYERFKLVPQECFFIDDTEDNITASKKTGMQGHIFDFNDIQKLKQDLINSNVRIDN